MLPYLLLFTTFIILPVIIAICISFTSFNIMESPQWIGIQNYVNLFVNDELFIKSIVNTIMFAVVIGPGGYLLSLLLAWLLNDLTRGLRVFFHHYFLCAVHTGGMTIIWGFLFSGDMQGLINSTLYRFGLITTPISVLSGHGLYRSAADGHYALDESGHLVFVFHCRLAGRGQTILQRQQSTALKPMARIVVCHLLPLMKPQLMFGAVDEHNQCLFLRRDV